jgi:argininosuccinate synthase
MATKKVVLAYSGGLDTSVILHWLKKTHGYEVIAYCADIGQEDELSGLEEKALKTGASKLYIENLIDDFANDYVFPVIRGSAVYEMRYLLGTSVARPLIAKKQVEIALSEGAVAISHGATGKGNDQVRFEAAAMALAPNLQIIAPWREWSFQGREDLIAYAKSEDIPITVSAAKPYSMDRNLLHVSYEGGLLEDPMNEPDESMYILTKAIANTPNQEFKLEIQFEYGNAISINNEKMTPAQILQYLNKVGGDHGVGRIDIVENRLVGIKSRGCYETPGGTILHLAHRDLESITIERELQHKKDEISHDYAIMVYNGLWFHPKRLALQHFIDYTQRTVNGTVRVSLHKGNVRIIGRSSPNSLYRNQLASFEGNEDYNQADAAGFIKLFGLTAKESYKNFILPD